MERNVAMKGRIFGYRGKGSNQIAKERLKLMTEAGVVDASPVALRRMKKEISAILSRYYNLAPENYEIRVILKQNRKRA